MLMRRHSPAREPTRLGVCFDELGQVVCGRAVGGLERGLDHLGDPEKREPAVEEGGDRDLVGRVEDGRVRPARLAGAAGEREQRERLQVGRGELQGQAGGEVEPAARPSRRVRDSVSAKEIGTVMSG